MKMLFLINKQQQKKPPKKTTEHATLQKTRDMGNNT
jgi:hypothetical protein